MRLLDDRHDPARHHGDEPGEVPELHGFRMWLPVVPAFGNPLQGRARAGHLALELGDEEFGDCGHAVKAPVSCGCRESCGSRVRCRSASPATRDSRPPRPYCSNIPFAISPLRNGSMKPCSMPTCVMTAVCAV